MKYFSEIVSLLLAGAFMLASCSDNDNSTIYHSPIISSVTTGDVSATAVSAVFTGSVKDLSSQSSASYRVGVKLSTSETDVKTGTEINASPNSDGSFTVEQDGLQRNQTYYYCTFVNLQGKVSYYGDVKSFVTTDASVVTISASDIQANKATFGGQLNDVGNLPSSATLSGGVKISMCKDEASLLSGKDISLSDLSSATAGKAFSLVDKGLLPAKKYYYVAYMKLNDGYILGKVDSLTTSDYETQFVDLGLSVKWAATNIGASSEEEAGGLYGYGDPTGLQENPDASYATGDISGSSLDIALASASGGRLPTVTEAQELVNKCVFSDTIVNKVPCFKVTGPNGNSIVVPKAGSRNGDTVSGEGSEAYFWTGSIDPNSTDHGYTVNLGNKSFKTSSTFMGLSVRAVKQTLIDFDNSKLVLLNNSADARIEIYNEYGATKNDPGLDPAGFMFTKKMYVTFSIYGLPKNIAPFDATIGWADASWSPSDWSSSVRVIGDGTYTIPVTVTETARGIAVFVIDLKGKAGLFDDGTVKAYINSIVVDDDHYLNYGSTSDGQSIDNSKLIGGDIEKNGKYRIEIYNVYGSGSKDNPTFSPTNMNFSHRLRVIFSLSGIGKLSTSCRADLIFADASWGVSNWGQSVGSTNVAGDGIYSVYLDTGGSSAIAPPNVFAVDIDGLSSSVGADRVKACLLGVYWY